MLTCAALTLNGLFQPLQISSRLLLAVLLLKKTSFKVYPPFVFIFVFVFVLILICICILSAPDCSSEKDQFECTCALHLYLFYVFVFVIGFVFAFATVLKSAPDCSSETDQFECRCAQLAKQALSRLIYQTISCYLFLMLIAFVER